MNETIYTGGMIMKRVKKEGVYLYIFQQIS